MGLTSAGRSRLHTEGLIGFFVNTLVARARLEDDPPFGALLRRVRDTVLAAQKHQDVPFERLVEELQPERVAGLTPLFQAAFTYLASPLSPVPMRGLAVELLDVEVGVAKFDLTLSVYESGGRLNGWVEYRTGLFDPATVERWMGHLRVLLETAVADPSRRLSELPLLSAAERWQVAGEWNATALPLPLERCLHELVEAQAARTPDAPAVVAEDGELTYRELDTRAERLARRLRRAGGGAGGGRGPLRRALGGDGRRPAGHPQSRRRLRAARSRVPRRASGRHARRHRRAGAAGAGRAGREAAAAPRAGALPGPRGRRWGGRRSARRAARHRGQPRLRDLHLGLDRPPQGGDVAASRAGQPAALGAGDLPADRRRRDAAQGGLRLRRRDLGVLRAADRRRAAGRRPSRRPPGRGLSRARHRRARGDGRPFRAVDAGSVPARGGGGGVPLAAPGLLRRRGAVAGVARALPRPLPRRASGQRVRADRDLDRHHPLGVRAGAGPAAGADRAADRQHAPPSARPRFAAGADRRSRGAVRGRRGGGARLLWTAGADRRAVRSRS